MKKILFAFTSFLILAASVNAQSFCADNGQCSAPKQFMAKAEGSPKSAAKTSAAQPTRQEAAQNLSYIVYYFHGNRRCATCKKIEAQAKSVVESAFAAKIKQGELTFTSVNTDEEQNKHFINDFNLLSSGVVIVKTNGKGEVQKYKNLPKVWPLAWKEDSFNSYVKDEINKFFMEIL